MRDILGRDASSIIKKSHLCVLFPYNLIPRIFYKYATANKLPDNSHKLKHSNSEVLPFIIYNQSNILGHDPSSVVPICT